MVAEASKSVGPDLFPFESRFADLEGCRVHYVDEGSGPVLLMLHGNPTWSFLYRNVIRSLRDSFRCIALDYPGFGFSKAPAGYGFTPAEHATVVEGFVRRLELRDLTLVGQDWGGPIGLTVATRDPARFHGFVLGNTWAWPLNLGLRFEAFARISGGPIGRALIARFNAFVNLALRMGATKRLSAQEMRAYRDRFPDEASREPTYVFPRELVASRAFLEELYAGLPRIAHLPLLLVWGMRDPALRGAERAKLESLFPRHETVELQGAGHFIQEDAPHEIAAAIKRWWPTTTAA